MFLFNPNAQSLATPQDLLVFDWRMNIFCSASDVFTVTELWPVASGVYTTVACGGNMSLVMEGRSAVVLSVELALPQAVDVHVTGRGSRAHSTARLEPVSTATGQLQLVVSGVLDAPLGDVTQCGAALYALLPVHVRNLAGVLTANGTRLQFREALASAPSVQGCVTPRAVSAPHPPPGYYAIEISVPAPAVPTFVHSQPVAGMGYNASFTGGNLTGVVNVPAAVFSQLASRNASYPVPWVPADLSVAWLNPARLLVYIDGGASLPQTSSLLAWLNGASIPVHPVWNCRSLRIAQCFDGWWLDLTAAGVQPDVAASLTLSIPSVPAGSFIGVYYDNVDTVYASCA